MKTCQSCTVYRSNSGDEIQRLAEYFDLMAMTLKKRLQDIKTFQERMVQSQKLESIGQLAAGVAHELNTPLGIVLGYTQLMLQDFNSDSEYHEWLTIQEKLQQVFLNLLNNAHDAIGSEGSVTVATRHDREKNEVVVSVADTGSGIPPEVLSRIFDPFLTTKPVGKGTGLGLSVTFGIVNDHGGHIEIDSQSQPMEAEADSGRGKGTVFLLRFPIYQPVCTESTTEE
jgi:signal transduction histidine kinase